MDCDFCGNKTDSPSRVENGLGLRSTICPDCGVVLDRRNETCKKACLFYMLFVAFFLFSTAFITGDMSICAIAIFLTIAIQEARNTDANEFVREMTLD